MLLENVQILPNEQCAQVATSAPVISDESICARYPYTYPYAVGPDCEVHIYIFITACCLKSNFLYLYTYIFAPPNAA